MQRFHPAKKNLARAAAYVWPIWATLLVPRAAHAHFVLEAPACWMSQDSSGFPEKLGPCGDEGGGTATGQVTTFRPGEAITIRINEVVFHPGHYRVALAIHDRSELPKEPDVTPGSKYPCGTAKVETPAIFPVLGDDLLDHTAPFGGPRTMEVILPADVTCTKCTLQVLEFMSEHGLNDPGGCFYHHCADISIQGTPVQGPQDAGVQDSGAPPNGSDGGGAMDSGGCAMVPGEQPAAWGFAGVFALMFAARWRRRAGR
jgi:MYXO-CTERM domain-containing protein